MAVTRIVKRVPPGMELFDTGVAAWPDRVMPGSNPPAPESVAADDRREPAFHGRPCARCGLPIVPVPLLRRVRFCRRAECVRARKAEWGRPAQPARAKSRPAKPAPRPTSDTRYTVMAYPVEPTRPEPVYDGRGALIGMRVWSGGEGLAGPCPSTLAGGW